MTEKANTKVFVGRLPQDGCSSRLPQDLNDLFSNYGTVSQLDVIGKYAFVHMNKPEEAEEAIKKLNNYNFMGSQLTVQLSTSKKKDGPGKAKKPLTPNRTKRSPGQYRNNSFPSPRPPHYDPYGPPPPAPASRFGAYYDEMNPYYRDPYYRVNDPYYRDSGDNMRSAPYEPPPYGRRPPPQTVDYSRGPPREFYDRGDSQFQRPSPFELNRPMPPSEPRAMSFGGPSRNGFGNVGFPNRGPAGGHRPPLPPTARWQPY